MIGETTVLRDAVLSLLDASVVVLDLARVSGVDAHGLGLLLELREETGSNGIHFKLMNVTTLVRQVLEITCLNTVFKVTSEAEVLSKALPHQPVAPIDTADEHTLNFVLCGQN